MVFVSKNYLPAEWTGVGLLEHTKGTFVAYASMAAGHKYGVRLLGTTKRAEILARRLHRN